MNAPTADRRDLSNLTKICSGGAPIAPATVEAWERKFGVYIRNIYGLTETTSPSHCVPFGAGARRSRVRRAVGRVPVFNTLVRVVDDAGHDVPLRRAQRLNRFCLGSGLSRHEHRDERIRVVQQRA